LFRTKFNYDEEGNTGIIHLKSSAIFSNYLSVKSEIEKHADKDKVVLDFANVNLLDHSFREHINELKNLWDKNGRVLELINQDHLIPVSDHPLAAKISLNLDHLGITKLSGKQQEFQEFADNHGLDYYSGKSLSFNQYRDFSFNLIGRLEFTENMMCGTIEGYWMIFNEVSIDTDVETKAIDTKLPTMLINYGGKALPKFTMELEGFFDKLKAYAGIDDIDFDGHPKFSDKFLLKGPDEKSIRDLFTDDLIELIESNPIYHIESNGSSIIIYPFDKNSEISTINDMIEFSRKIAQKLNVSKKQL
jgi:carbonic anhydrase